MTEKIHFALKQPNTSFPSYGGSVDSLTFYHALLERVRALVNASSFGPFIAILTIGTRIDNRLLRALVEQWWDTTKTFHFRFGGITVNLLDFAAITGLRVGWNPILYDSGLYLDPAVVEYYLGKRLGGSELVVKYTNLEGCLDHEPKSEVEVAYMSRAYLLYLFGVSLFLNRRSGAHRLVTSVGRLGDSWSV